MTTSDQPHDHLQPRPRRGRRQHPVFAGVIAILIAAIAYGAFTTGAVGPSFGKLKLPHPIAIASLSYSGADVTITGSVDHMFKMEGTFVGPNRAEKQNRALVLPDVMAVVRGFEEVRIRLASLRANPSDAIEMPQSRVGGMLPPVPEIEAEPRISVAAINPTLASPALDAIDDVAAPDPSMPVPLVLSEKIAYARATVPATNFEVLTDSNGKEVSEKELWCLATAIYFEARGESYRGQVAVAQVVLNRTKHRIYPKTICGVVFQNQNKRNACQFSFACDGVPERVADRKSWDQANEIAEGAIRGSLYLTEVGHATHYHATYVYPHWAPRMKKLTKIGLHVFYQFKTGWRFG